MLSLASPVLSAALASGMREGQLKRIAVRDSPAAACRLSLDSAIHTSLLTPVLRPGARLLSIYGRCRFFLDLLYTGTSTAEVDHGTVLGALELAHRWQVDGVTSMLEAALPSFLDDDTFAPIAEAAALKDLPDLKVALVEFAATSSAVASARTAGRLPPVVLELLGEQAEAAPPPTAKRKRRSF